MQVGWTNYQKNLNKLKKTSTFKQKWHQHKHQKESTEVKKNNNPSGKRKKSHIWKLEKNENI